MISRCGKPGLDRLDHAAELVDPAEVVEAAALHLRRQLLDEVGAAERVDRVGDARLVGDDLLRAQGELDGEVRRQRERLVERVGVERVAFRRARRRAPGSPCARRCCRAAAPSASSRPSGCGSGTSRSAGPSRRSAPASSSPRSRRAARNLAISSKKSLCELKKKERRGANSSTGRPASIPYCTYSTPSRSVKASSWSAVEPASRMW